MSIIPSAPHLRAPAKIYMPGTDPSSARNVKILSARAELRDAAQRLLQAQRASGARDPLDAVQARTDAQAALNRLADLGVRIGGVR